MNGNARVSAGVTCYAHQVFTSCEMVAFVGEILACICVDNAGWRCRLFLVQNCNKMVIS